MNEKESKVDDKLDDYNDLLNKYYKLSNKHRILCQDYVSLIKQMNNLATNLNLNDGGKDGTDK